MGDIIARLCQQCEAKPALGAGELCEVCSLEHLEDQLDAPSPEGSKPFFPMDALIGPAGDLVKALAPQTEAPTSFLWFDLLTALGCSIGPAAYLYQGGRHPPRLFCLMVGPTSSGRKGTSRSVINEMMEELDPDLPSVEGVTSGEGLIELVRDPYEDAKGNHKGGTDNKKLLLVDEEFRRTHVVSRRVNSAVAPIIRQSWDWKNLSNPRVDSVKATKPHICCVAHCTPEELVDLTDAMDVYSGFLNRYLLIWGERDKRLTHAPRPSGSSVDVPLRNLRKVLPKARTVTRVQLSTDAAEFWDWLYIVNHKDEEGPMGALTQRKMPYILRIALILALLDGLNYIERRHLESAAASWGYVDTSIRFLSAAYGLGTNTQSQKKGHEMAETRISEDRIKRILQALASAQENGCTRYDLTRGVLGGNVPAAEFDHLMRLEVAEGKIVKVDEVGRGGRNGRSERYWLVGFHPHRKE